MLVYGDRVRSETPGALLDRIRADLAGAAAEPLWILRHERRVRALIEAGRLAQGLADAAFEAAGCDKPDPDADAALALARRIAASVIASWSSHPSSTAGTAAPEAGAHGSSVPALRSASLGTTVKVKSPEGYAFYALYPESYAAAAAGEPPAGVVIGLRSIGTSLAAVVAAQLRAETLVTARPCGHPFARELKLLRPAPTGPVAIFDEGPGLSGSSFAAAADWAEAAGVAPGAITFYPSHLGEPGPQASATHRRRWASARRRHVAFEALLLAPASPHPLADWFADRVGPAIAPLADLSGGAWRRGEDAPAHPQQERRKFLLRTENGDFLLKFAGLGVQSQAKFERARALHAAGFTAEPVALRHGFLLERWLGGARPLAPPDRPQLVETLGAYLAFRARRFPASAEDGAGAEELIEMAACNAGALLGPAAGEAARARLAPLREAALRPVRIDGRLHAWEWRVLPDGRVLKTDALDHDDAHDLVGCQDVAWDVAGAAVELDLTPEEAAALARRCGREPALCELMTVPYLAFQAGAWTLAASSAPAEEQRRLERLIGRYRDRLARALG